MGISISGSSLLTMWMKHHTTLIYLFLDNMDPISVYFLWMGLVVALEGVIFIKSDVYSEIKNKESDLDRTNNADYPKNIFIKLGIFTVITSVYLFFFPILEILMFNKILVILVLLINFISLYLISGELIKMIYVVIKLFLYSITDSKDRLVVAITFIGTMISLIALFR